MGVVIKCVGAVDNVGVNSDAGAGGGGEAGAGGGDEDAMSRLQPSNITIRGNKCQFKMNNRCNNNDYMVWRLANT